MLNMDVSEDDDRNGEFAESKSGNTRNVSPNFASLAEEANGILNIHPPEHNGVHMTEEVHEEPISEEFHAQRFSTTESDAIHPRFQTQDPEQVREWQIKYDYYCAYCNQFFAPSVAALRLHFKGDMVQHEPYGSCFYCKGDVFSYTSNNQRQLYHDCRQQNKD